MTKKKLKICVEDGSSVDMSMKDRNNDIADDDMEKYNEHGIILTDESSDDGLDGDDIVSDDEEFEEVRKQKRKAKEKKIKTMKQNLLVYAKEQWLQFQPNVATHEEELRSYDTVWKKSDCGKLQVVCVENCPWMLYASKLAGEPTRVIKTYVGEHTCVRACKNKQASSAWLAKVIMPAIKLHPNYSTKDIIRDVTLIYGIQVEPMTYYRAKCIARGMLRGTYEEHYAQCRSYILALRKMDSEGKFELKTTLDNKDRPLFRRIYIGFSALRKGKNPDTFVDAFFHITNVLETYKHALTPMDDRNEWPKSNEPPVLPPEHVKLPGRPPKNRKKDQHEEPKQGQKKLSLKGVMKMTCSKCGKFDHNKRSWKTWETMEECRARNSKIFYCTNKAERHN
ncbi:hypothetical protein C2S53_002756 [Perilla frutescens var. hirtella]|uniref:Uncharacterized protein n=1 Tax=Perilla frutescens var. hirtella TaxID=608512 RepID=A0AAD4P3U3_PERFH|nr:hypothetical protein C2S53_002756 [Perilla frutescens var. hirtella]